MSMKYLRNTIAVAAFGALAATASANDKDKFAGAKALLPADPPKESSSTARGAIELKPAATGQHTIPRAEPPSPVSSDTRKYEGQRSSESREGWKENQRRNGRPQ